LAIVVGQMKSREIEAAHKCRALEESWDRLSLDYDRLYSDYWSQRNVIDDLKAPLANNNAGLISELQENITSLEEWHYPTSTGFVANAPIRMRAAVIQGLATFVRHPTQSARRWWFLFPLPCRRQSLCAFASQHAPPVLPLTCPLQMRRRLWHPHRQQSLWANQRATPVDPDAAQAVASAASLAKAVSIRQSAPCFFGFRH
jgi:hypothetical protein